VVRGFKTENSIGVVEKLISEIEKFLLLPLDNEEFETIIIEELGCEYTPRSQGLNKRQFLEQSLEILKEPMEETQKYFIPKFIG
jgi:CdiI immunity protein